MDEETSEWIEFSLALVVMMVALAIIKFSHASTFTLHDDGSMGSFYQEQQQRQREQERRKAPKRRLERPADPDRLFTVEELKTYDGSNSTSPIYVACKGIVFDVTESGFYDDGDAYAAFSGREASKGLGTMDLYDESMLHSYEELEPSDLDTLNDWFEKYDWKYVRVGKMKDSPLLCEADDIPNAGPPTPFRPWERMEMLRREMEGRQRREEAKGRGKEKGKTEREEEKEKGEEIEKNLETKKYQ